MTEGNRQIPPLPARTPFQPWEDLPSFVARTAKRMHYENPLWILHPRDAAGGRASQKLPLLPRKAADYQLLTRLLHVDQQTVYLMTLHRFVFSLQAPTTQQTRSTQEIPFPLLSSKMVSWYFRTRWTVRVCPQCLEEGIPYGRLFWHFPFVVICPSHKKLLIQTCPVCDSPIPTLRPNMSRCPFCDKGDYRSATASYCTNPFLLASQNLILERLGVETPPSKLFTPVVMKPPLSSLLPWQYFQVMASFRVLLEPLILNKYLLNAYPELQAPTDQSSRHPYRDSVAVEAAFLGIFHTLFDEWPDRFFRILDAVKQAGGYSLAPGLTQAFSPFYREHWLELLGEPTLRPFGEAVTEYLVRGYTDGRLHRSFLRRHEHGIFVGKEQAAKLLQIGRITLDRLLRQGALTQLHQISGKSSQHDRFLLSIEPLSRSD